MTDKTSNISAQTPPANHHDSDQGQPADAGTKEVWEKSSDTEQPKAEEPVPEVKADYVPPNGGYGWVCVGSAFGINANTWGINSSYGVFLAYYLSNRVFPGATTLDFAFIGGLSISMALFVSPIATTTTRVFGTRTTLFIGVFFQTLSLIGSSFTKRIWQLYLSQGVCFGWGMGFLFVGSVGVTPQWFTTRRSLANGIAAAGSGLGGLMYSLATNAMIQRIGLGWAFRIIGIVSCVVNVICSLLLKDRNAQLNASQLAFDYHLFRRPEFLLLQGYGFFSMLAYILLLFSLPDYGRSVGLTPRQGSVIGALLNLGQALGRPPIGYFSDTIGRINMATTMTFLAGLFCLLIWVFAKSYGVLIFFALICGPVSGTFWTTIGPVSAEVVGLRHLPSALSITWLMLVPPTLFSEPMALEITSRSPTGYLGAQLLAGFIYIAAAACTWALRAWKIGEMERLAAALGKSVESVDPVASADTAAVPPVGSAEAAGLETQMGGFVRRLLAWKKV